MPRKKSEGERVATAEDQTLVLPPSVLLTYEERTELKTMFASMAFKKALRNCRLKKPKVNLPRTLLNSPAGAIVANNCLHEIRGWEAFEEAMHEQSENPVAKLPQPKDEYNTPA